MFRESAIFRRIPDLYWIEHFMQYPTYAYMDRVPIDENSVLFYKVGTYEYINPADSVSKYRTLQEVTMKRVG